MEEANHRRERGKTNTYPSLMYPQPQRTKAIDCLNQLFFLKSLQQNGWLTEQNPWWTTEQKNKIKNNYFVHHYQEVPSKYTWWKNLQKKKNRPTQGSLTTSETAKIIITSPQFSDIWMSTLIINGNFLIAPFYICWYSITVI